MLPGFFYTHQFIFKIFGHTKCIGKCVIFKNWNATIEWFCFYYAVLSKNEWPSGFDVTKKQLFCDCCSIWAKSFDPIHLPYIFFSTLDFHRVHSKLVMFILWWIYWCGWVSTSGCCLQIRITHSAAELVIVKGSGPTFMGRDWLQVLKLNWQENFHLHSASNSSLLSVLEKHPSVFKEGLGTLKGFEAKIFCST